MYTLYKASSVFLPQDLYVIGYFYFPCFLNKSHSNNLDVNNV